ncbi:MAG TPA: ATP-dependent chaperone ClpB, partial [Rhodobacteraceae bacterium]|nr:ATP-dependent chaperone ClpB [Paracoccaceae bacterium]
MNFEKFTERSKGFVQAAQTIAQREDHQRFLPEHLLKALLDDEQGMAGNLIKSAGGDPKIAVAGVETALGKLPKVEGDGQLYMDGQTNKVLREAEKLARKAGDSFVAVERLLTALAIVKSKAADALKDAGVNAQSLNAAINKIRAGRTADSASAEDTYEALKKF